MRGTRVGMGEEYGRRGGRGGGVWKEGGEEWGGEEGYGGGGGGVGRGGGEEGEGGEEGYGMGGGEWVRADTLAGGGLSVGARLPGAHPPPLPLLQPAAC